MEVRVIGKGRYYAEQVHYEPGENSRPLARFPAKELEQFNGNHFIYGWAECFFQSDYVAGWMHKEKLYIEVLE